MNAATFAIVSQTGQHLRASMRTAAFDSVFDVLKSAMKYLGHVDPCLVAVDDGSVYAYSDEVAAESDVDGRGERPVLVAKVSA